MGGVTESIGSEFDTNQGEEQKSSFLGTSFGRVCSRPTMNIYSVYRLLQPRFRARRMRHLTETFRLNEETTILDVGGVFDGWDGFPVSPRITILNIDDVASGWKMPPNLTYVISNGRHLEHAKSFDLVYSNSVIEPVGTFEEQERFASEVRRVGRQVYAQTPNKHFFIAPHFIAPGVHLLPRKWQPFLVRWQSARGWLRRDDNKGTENLIRELRLFSLRQLNALFPDCEIISERLLILYKSFTAVRVAP